MNSGREILKHLGRGFATSPFVVREVLDSDFSERTFFREVSLDQVQATLEEACISPLEQWTYFPGNNPQGVVAYGRFQQFMNCWKIVGPTQDPVGPEDEAIDSLLFVESLALDDEMTEKMKAQGEAWERKEWAHVSVRQLMALLPDGWIFDGFCADRGEAWVMEDRPDDYYVALEREHGSKYRHFRASHPLRVRIGSYDRFAGIMPTEIPTLETLLERLKECEADPVRFGVPFRVGVPVEPQQRTPLQNALSYSDAALLKAIARWEEKFQSGVCRPEEEWWDNLSLREVVQAMKDELRRRGRM